MALFSLGGSSSARTAPPYDIHSFARIAWWDWPFDTIISRLGDFQSADIAAFCDRWDPPAERRAAAAR